MMIPSSLALLAALLSAAQSPAAAARLPLLGDDPPPLQDDDLRQEIEEKSRILQDLHRAHKEEEDKLKAELSDLWTRALGPIPRAIGVRACADYGVWGHAIRMGNGPGYEAGFSLGSWAQYSEEGMAQRLFFTPVPGPDAGMLGFGIRQFFGRDERAGGRVEMLTYEIVRLQVEQMWPSGLGTGYSFTFGIARLANHGPGGDRDTAHEFTVGLPNLKVQLHRNVRIGAGVTWDFLRTSFNQTRTHTVISVVPSLSLDVNF